MTEFELASRIAERVQAAQGRALFVGGWVRDRLLGRDSKDIDLEIHGIEAAPLRTLLEEIAPVNAVGESFTVYKVGAVDVALPRTESKTGRVTADSRSPATPTCRSRPRRVGATSRSTRLPGTPPRSSILTPTGG